MSRSHLLFIPLVATVACAACQAPSQPPAPVNRQPIFYGDPDHEYSSVIRLHGPTSLCSGAIIGPSLILTAHHCLYRTRGDSWTVEEGERPPLLPVVDGFDVYLPEHASSEEAEDIALLETSGPVPLEPYLTAVDVPTDLLGSEVTVVGFGEDEHGDAGYRQRGTMTVAEVGALHLTLVGDAYPYSGDSGGPVFDRRGQIVGVISRGWDGGVVVARVDTHRFFLDPVLRETGGCVPGDPEVCDGIDNNCNGEVDPGCSSPGEACSSDDDCVESECLAVAGEDICTKICSPEADNPDCWPGTYCFEPACGEGLCRSGEPGEGGVGEECSDDRDCETLRCSELDDGQRRCTRRCRVDHLECGNDEVCIPVDGECGGCLPMDVAGPQRGVGEPCTDDEECRDGLRCITDHPHQYCSRDCDGPIDCPEGTHCRDDLGACVRGNPAEAGRPCITDDDCEEGLCWQSPEGFRFCTEPCRSGQNCPRRFSCDPIAEVCVPWDVTLGQLCGEEAECLEALCVELDGENRCATSCDRFCPSGFECMSLDEGAYCWPAEPPSNESGCNCAAAGDLRTTLTALLKLILN